MQTHLDKQAYQFYSYLDLILGYQVEEVTKKNISIWWRIGNKWVIIAIARALALAKK